MHNYARTLGFRGWGYFFLQNFISQKVKVSSSIHLNACTYYVCGIKLETKLMRLHKIWVEKMSLFHQKEVCCHRLLTFTCNVSMCQRALRCIISTYCIYHSLDKHIFERKIVIIFLRIRCNL